MSSELEKGLIQLGLQQYLSACVRAGFSDWESLSEINESDFDALNIRLGDRRKLQREIARRQLWPENSPLPTPDELREFKLSNAHDDSSRKDAVQASDSDRDTLKTKNGIQHMITEATSSSAISGSPALEAWPFDIQELGSGDNDPQSWLERISVHELGGYDYGEFGLPEISVEGNYYTSILPDAQGAEAPIAAEIESEQGVQQDHEHLGSFVNLAPS